MPPYVMGSCKYIVGAVFAAALPQLANDYGKVNDECWHVPKTKHIMKQPKKTGLNVNYGCCELTGGERHVLFEHTDNCGGCN